jgi:glucokinase
MQCRVHRKEALCHDGPDGTVVTRQVIRMIQAACNEAGRTPDAVGISTAGPLSSKKKSIRKSPNMPYADIPLREPLEAAFSCPVFILNDASAGAYNEYRRGNGEGQREREKVRGRNGDRDKEGDSGSEREQKRDGGRDGYRDQEDRDQEDRDKGGQGCRNLVYLTLSTGIGCGVISDGRLLEGLNGNAGEAGHFCVDTSYDLPCGCGGRGHWEAYASGSGMPQFYRAWYERHGSKPPTGKTYTPKTLCAAAHAGDPDAIAFFRDLAQINGRGLSTIIAAYAPELIIVGGPVATENPDLVVEQARRYVDRYLPMPEIVLSNADGMGPLMGAAVFARDCLGDC